MLVGEVDKIGTAADEADAKWSSGDDQEEKTLCCWLGIQTIFASLL